MITTLIVCLVVILCFAFKHTRNIIFGIFGLIFGALIATWYLIWAAIYIVFWLAILIGVPAAAIYGVWHLLHRH